MAVFIIFKSLNSGLWAPGAIVTTAVPPAAQQHDLCPPPTHSEKNTQLNY